MKLRTKFLVLVAALTLCSVAFAEYNSDYDWYLSIDGFVGDIVAEALPVAELGSTLFDGQEGAHQTITGSTGAEVDHFYIWVCTGDECIPVDPVRFSN